MKLPNKVYNKLYLGEIKMRIAYCTLISYWRAKRAIAYAQKHGKRSCEFRVGNLKISNANIMSYRVQMRVVNLLRSRGYSTIDLPGAWIRVHL